MLLLWSQWTCQSVFCGHEHISNVPPAILTDKRGDSEEEVLRNVLWTVSHPNSPTIALFTVFHDIILLDWYWTDICDATELLKACYCRLNNEALPGSMGKSSGGFKRWPLNACKLGMSHLTKMLKKIATMHHDWWGINNATVTFSSESGGDESGGGGGCRSSQVEQPSQVEFWLFRKPVFVAWSLSSHFWPSSSRYLPISWGFYVSSMPRTCWRI